MFGQLRGVFMLNYRQFKLFVEDTISLSGFNLTEYQDKYYFKIKMLEVFPQFTEKEIYEAINNSIDNSSPMNSNLAALIIGELFKIYSAKTNDSYLR